MTAAFTDALGRRWHVPLDVALAERVLDEIDVDLLEAATVPRLLSADPVLTFRVLSVLLADRITEGELSRRLKAESVADAADAIVQAITEFFPPTPEETPDDATQSDKPLPSPLECCYRLAGAVGVNPLTPGITARKLTWMHEGRRQCGEVASVLAAVFGPEQTITTNDPRILFPH